jgi:DNA polymerase III sliding clamp (beta) subunit (PCNA family)
MEFFVEKTELLQQLNFVPGAAEKRTTIPILITFCWRRRNLS